MPTSIYDRATRLNELSELQQAHIKHQLGVCFRAAHIKLLELWETSTFVDGLVQIQIEPIYCPDRIYDMVELSWEVIAGGDQVAEPYGPVATTVSVGREPESLREFHIVNQISGEAQGIHQLP